VLKLVLVFSCFWATLLWRAPATLVDTLLKAVSDDRLRLADAQGTVWSGGGTFVRRQSDGTAIAWMPLAWQFMPSALLEGALGWRGTPDSGLQGELRVGVSGYALEGVSTRANADTVLPLLPGPIAKLGWQGELRLQGAHWQCAWTGLCTGRLQLDWVDAQVALLPQQRLGDYEVTLVARQEGKSGQLLAFEVRTLTGALKVEGEGSLSGQGGLAFEGRLRGPQHIQEVIPSMAYGYARPNTKAGGLVLSYPQRQQPK
jgi:general secretion pathway protein N